jgi:hypothetical protein
MYIGGLGANKNGALTAANDTGGTIMDKTRTASDTGRLSPERGAADGGALGGDDPEARVEHERQRRHHVHPEVHTREVDPNDTHASMTSHHRTQKIQALCI